MKLQKQQILFDLDDTLVHCNKYFELILSQFGDLLGDWFQPYRVNAEDIRTKQIEIDIVGVSKLGFASLHFPQSLIDTYRNFSCKKWKVSSRECGPAKRLPLKDDFYIDLFHSGNHPLTARGASFKTERCFPPFFEALILVKPSSSHFLTAMI